eukprot:CAMPEP_0203880236 /NCGR_PEP_ID=MMETSP0359-20131031/24632_1 /ASSEMBLY_ACC=CAM_ASM_000338 /TAXON_ID=268821 /ORGANISM="Scrippsiella Hangoei, Strain SHTV-5" /LENGTH=74 /DNA_ID=CAMNT_0050799819 /DNA_START=16 /DNA_END=237 /DNA_ORIENTATION=+
MSHGCGRSRDPGSLLHRCARQCATSTKCATPDAPAEMRGGRPHRRKSTLIQASFHNSQARGSALSTCSPLPARA